MSELSERTLELVGFDDGDDPFVVAARHVDLARHALDGGGGGDDGVGAARWHLESAIDGLRPAVADDDLPGPLRHAAEQWRADLSSYLLAALNLDAAGVPPTTVVRLLRRATQGGVTSDHDAAAPSRGASYL